MNNNTPNTATVPPSTPFLGQRWYNTTDSKHYIWIGRWCELTPDDDIDPMKEAEEAYNRAKGIL